MRRVKAGYRAVYRRLPRPVRGWLTGLVHNLPGKPSVRPCDVPPKERFPEGCRGALVVSADFEMAWAWRFAISGGDAVEIGLRERANVPVLLDMLDRWQVPVTWATVGHLMLEECSCGEGPAHPELSRIPHFTNRVWAFEQGDWYDHDPCTGVEQDPAWYAPDLVRAVLDARAGHELACHTFSHLDCTDANCPPEVLDDEIAACAALAREYGAELTSMVFPGGTNGNYPVLARHGFTSVRLNAPWDLFYPWRDPSGLWVLPSSACIENHGFGWSAGRYRRHYARYLDKALSSNTVCHLWFHPSVDEFCLHEIMPAVFEEARRRADDAGLWLTTMAGMAAFCRSRLEGRFGTGGGGS